MHMLQSLFYLTTALHVSGVTITNKTPYFSWPSTPCLRQQPHENKNRSKRHPQHTQISSNSSTIAADNNTCMYIIHYCIELILFSAEYTLLNNNCNFNLIYRHALSVNLTLFIIV
jgi:hypothetical protein